MKNVLFYGDSNTWGYQGDNPMHRLDADKRYTGVVAVQFPDVHFIEEGLCGRTICSTDPIDYGRNGMAMLPALLATHDPLDVIVIMLGTNATSRMSLSLCSAQTTARPCTATRRSPSAMPWTA